MTTINGNNANGNNGNNVNANALNANANGNNPNDNNDNSNNNNGNNVNVSARNLNNGNDEDDTVYKVVVNHEEQYSIWPNERDNALGWFDVGISGTKAECLDHIEKVWTDMRPLSLRKHMELHNAARAAS
jgi:MbtH protein